MVTKKLNRIYGISFMWSFFILYWLPVMYRFLINFFHDIASPLILWKLIRYLWIIETDIVWGQHYPVRPYTEDIDTHFGYQALIASIILSVIIAIIAAWIDKKYHKLSFLRTYGFNVLYVLIARITSLVMMLSGILKIYPDQFESSNSPGLLMSSVGSLKSIDIMWISNGSSQQYEIILGLIEFASGIFLWFSRTTILGGIIGSISMIFIELLDIFNSLPIYIFVSSILLGCLCVLAPEIPYFLRYFIQGKIDQHYVPVFSFKKMTHSQCWKTTLSASSAIIFIAFTLKTSLLFHTIYVSYSHSHSDPMYGIWDTQTETLTLGKYKLNSIGIENSFGHTHISLLTTDKGAMAANLWTQQRIKNHIKLYLPESNNQEINLELSSKNDLSLSFIHTGKPIIYHYHRRYIRFKDDPLRLTDEYLDTMPEF